MQGGGEIYLGPYDYELQSKANSDTDANTVKHLTIPENVTLIGVPGKTRIYKKVYYFEIHGDYAVNPKSLGPVVLLEGTRSGIINCEIDLDTESDLPDGATFVGIDGRNWKFTTSDGTVYLTSLVSSPFEENKATSIVYVESSWNRVQNCWIGAPYTLNSSFPAVRKCRGIYVAYAGTAAHTISNNNIRTLCAVATEGIYLAGASLGSSITGNIAEHDDTHAISVVTAEESKNGIAGNVGTTETR